MRTLKNFYVQQDNTNPFLAPECRGLLLLGVCDDHPDPRFKGHVIQLPHLKRIKGREVKTASGSIYHLVGEPDERYLDLLRKNGMEYDNSNPLEVLRDFLIPRY